MRAVRATELGMDGHDRRLQALSSPALPRFIIPVMSWALKLDLQIVQPTLTGTAIRRIARPNPRAQPFERSIPHSVQGKYPVRICCVYLK